jgi:hypothetical protein
MNVQQKFSLSVFPKWNKATPEGEAPIYGRIKVDGHRDEISLSLNPSFSRFSSVCIDG